MVISDISMFIESMEYNIEEKKNTKSLEELVKAGKIDASAGRED